jgi:hypothetical protein
MVNNFAFSLDWVLCQSIIFNVSALISVHCYTFYHHSDFIWTLSIDTASNEIANEILRFLGNMDNGPWIENLFGTKQFNNKET